jgi:hypothetical protein
MAGPTLDGVQLNDPAGRWQLNADTRLRVPAPAVINDVSIPGMHGVLPALTSTYSPGSAALSFDLEAPDYQTLLDYLAALGAACGSLRRLRVLADGDYRASVQFISSTELEVTADTFARITFTYSIPTGFWQDAGSVDVALSGGSQNPTALRGGSAPIVDALWLVSSGTTVTDDISDTWFRWGGSGTARINTYRQTAFDGGGWSGGSNVSGGLVLGPGQFQLSPGGSFTVSGGDGTVRARRAYL